MTEREALYQVRAILDVSSGNLTNGGLELSETELNYILMTIAKGLDNTNAQN